MYEIRARTPLANGEVAKGMSRLIAVWRDDNDNECFISVTEGQARKLIRAGEAVSTLDADVVLDGL